MMTNPPTVTAYRIVHLRRWGEALSVFSLQGGTMLISDDFESGANHSPLYPGLWLTEGGKFTPQRKFVILSSVLIITSHNHICIIIFSQSIFVRDC